MLIHDPNKFKKGDIVIVTRKAESLNGWDSYWTSSMDKFINNKYEILEVREYGYGLKLDKEEEQASQYVYYFPSFVLNNRKLKLKQILWKN